MSLSYIKIFPPIGIARVGNSQEEFFIGPEAPGTVPDNGGSYKDASGAVKRQAARFRVYGFTEGGEVSELTSRHPDVAAIKWTVSLANRKAEWFEFNGAEQVAKILGGDTSFPRRNADITGEDRKGLVIGPAEAEVTGDNQESSPMQGEFRVPGVTPQTVYLGELRTDADGRLLVLGGRGVSDTVAADNPLNHYANNNQWFDDTSDGPVTVEVTFKDGTTLKGRGQTWVIVAPPHYSPHTQNIVTLRDVVTEAVVAHGLAWNEAEIGLKPTEATISFTRDVYPILERLVRYQWVSRRAHRGHAAGKRGDFLNPQILTRLADVELAKRPDSPQKTIFSRLRTPIVQDPNRTSLASTGPLNPQSQEAINQANLFFMPPLAGDEGDVWHGDPKTWMSLTLTQYRTLAQWKEGQFTNDWTGSPPSSPSLSAIPTAGQPAALTLSALEVCQGGAFYPGIEITSVVRFRDFYSEAFRVAEHLEAGGITKWMALPWQADFYECRDHWWPSIRPDDVVPVSDYEQIVSEFPGEAEEGRVASLLIERQPWARGVGEGRPSRPGLPSPEPGQSATDYQDSVQVQLRRFSRTYLRFVPRSETDELAEMYRTRLEDFFARTILDTPDFQVPAVQQGADLVAYRRDTVLPALRTFLQNQTAVPAPAADESIDAYATRISQLAAGHTVWQGLLDMEWRSRVRHWGKNDLVSKWHRMGFVVPRTQAGETVYVEADRGRFDLLPFRKAFYYLLNIEQYPEFLPKAEELAREYLRLAWELEPLLRSDPSVEQYGFFRYDQVTFQARLEKIYEAERRAAEDYNPVTEVNEPLFRTPAQIVERIRQLAPFNQLDGSWLERIAKSGPIEDIRAFLFEIWSDEIGNGDPAQNHANVYNDLMHQAGIYLPPINSRAYAEHPDLWDASFSSPAYQAAIALFPETFFPELLGMTLYLEWEAIYLPAMVKLYEYHGYPSLFYRLHVAIDNPVNGHGARARDAVMRYLDHVRAESGDVEMQEHWRRVWNGYLAFKFIGDSDWQYRFANPPTLDERLLKLFDEKRHYAQLNHGTKRLGVNLLNDWFDEPDQFLDALRQSDLITTGDANRSRLFDLLNQTGPMLKVFSAKDRELLRDWVNSLPKAPTGGALPPGNAMRVLLNELQFRGLGVPEHESYQLTGKFADPAQDGTLVEVTKSIRWWFSIGQPEHFMAALARLDNGWIVPGNPDASRFVTELLSGSLKMAKFLSRTIPELDDKPARKVILDWIAAGCPQPFAPPGVAAASPAVTTAAQPLTVRPTAERSTLDEFAPEVVRQVSGSLRFTPDQRRGLHRRRYGPGGGAAH